VDEAEQPAQPGINPWMVGLGVLWGSLLALALILVALGARTQALGFDEGPIPSQTLAGIDYACAGVSAAAAVVVGAVQLGVAALRWHLDPGSRARVREAASGAPRPPRQDF
jgi:hypothetical protein